MKHISEYLNKYNQITMDEIANESQQEIERVEREKMEEIEPREPSEGFESIDFALKLHIEYLKEWEIKKKSDGLIPTVDLLIEELEERVKNKRYDDHGFTGEEN